MDIKNNIAIHTQKKPFYQKIIDRFCSYVKIPSESGNEKAMCDRLYQDLTFMGYHPKKLYLTNNCKTNGYNIYLYIKGNICGPSILFNAHMDTVSPGVNIKPSIENGTITSDGSTILGADDKCGVAAIVVLLETIKNSKLKHRDLEIIFTVCEETGMQGSQGLNMKNIKSNFGFVLDSSNPVGGLIVAAPSSCNIDVVIYGKSAHAGRSPEKGISAIQVGSKAISNMPLLRIDEDTTCNVGSFVSQFANNVVPDKAEIKINIRSLSDKKLESLLTKIRKIFERACAEYNARFDFSVEKRYNLYSKSKSDYSVKFVKSAMAKLNIEPYEIRACGGSDAHIFNANGIDVVNLGIGSRNVHSLDESVEISQLCLTYELILKMVTSD